MLQIVSRGARARNPSRILRQRAFAQPGEHPPCLREDCPGDFDPKTWSRNGERRAFIVPNHKSEAQSFIQRK